MNSPGSSSAPFSPPFSPNGKLFVLRYTRLEILPPAVSECEVLVEQGFPLVVFEFGEPDGRHFSGKGVGKIPRLRFYPNISFLPKSVQTVVTLILTFFKLCTLFAFRGRPLLMMTHGLREQVLALVLSKIFGTRYVCHLHEIFDPEELTLGNRLFLRMEKSVLAGAEFAVCPEEGRRKLFLDRYKLSTPIHFVPNGPRRNSPPVSREKIAREQLGIPDESIVLTYLGGIGPSAAIEETIAALPSLSHCHLILAGWGDSTYLATLQKLATEKGVADRLIFFGATKKKWSILDLADISLCLYKPSLIRLRHAATASNKLLESMAAGKPIIARDTPDFADIVSRYECGALTPLTPEGVAKAIRELTASPGRLAEMGANGRRAFESDFYFEKHFLPLLPTFHSYFPSLEPKPEAPLDLSENLV